MKKLKAEVVIVGDGCAALFAATQALNRGFSVALVNPSPGFGIADIRPRDGLALWDAAYRASPAGNLNLARLWDDFRKRVNDTLPVALDNAGLIRGESWSLLSSTPVHRKQTQFFESEYFRLERKPWTAGHVRLVNPDFVDMKFKSLGLRVNSVAAIEGAVIRQYTASWDALALGKCLSEFVYRKSEEDRCLRLVEAEIVGKVGRRLIIEHRGEEVSLEYEQACYILLSGGLLGALRPVLKQAIASDVGSWLQGARKRRREQHFAWFSRTPLARVTADPTASKDAVWFELGQISYRWDTSAGIASWQSGTGPDGAESVIDEALRMNGRCFSRATRSFRLEWDWKTPQWRETGYETYWGTAFEGDLWAVMELVWNLPS